jgi:hypothetical protein
MTTLGKVKETFIEKGRLIIKALTMGGASTAKQVSPFGIDSNPLRDLTAIYAETTNVGEAVILGYISKEYITEQGEIRIYSIGGDLSVKAYVHAKRNGDLALNGDDFSAIRYENFKTKIDLLQQDINTQLGLISAGIIAGGGAYSPTLLTVDFLSAKSPTVKLK